MSNTALYKAELLKHFKTPQNKHQGDFPDDMHTARGSNPQCGDDVQVGIKFSDEDNCTHISAIGFKGRGCSVCLAAASMMTVAVDGRDIQSASNISELMGQWINNKLEDEKLIPEVLVPLSAVKDHPARKKCVMLSFNALDILLNKARST
ncbi:Fe-S cluster assembly sulfur transfer protein SufU [Alteromonas sp. KUL49]|uniref:Fe-S cluster assembly sulfur transfer protein SufU n=1 Tax=Alteromonas sp. KUL49 TaxID=2480798 RepID=UPI00102EEA83|nr:SUF system NifU family Fe-S cluster assembly protein [Alteromonas sp. KUL49]TAP41219.1 SUF system NifU family Fe-S cluster assembly protein [Alteromonas sp. KUL49]GEA10264.1 iron-sulfur cluster assembly scaffold protein [Alteromonas sp. KUL49]